METILLLTVEILQEESKRNPDKFRKSGESFEPIVSDAIQQAIHRMGLNYTVEYSAGSHRFPDIIIMDQNGLKYGVEVKSTVAKGSSWKINGNSILGSTKDENVEFTYILFGKLRGQNSLFRYKPYEDVISDVIVTHSPRYVIDLEVQKSANFFSRTGIGYDELSNSDSPIEEITSYYRKQGKKAWWLAEATPASIQMFQELPPSQKNKYIAYGLAHYPELFSNSSKKFNRFSIWLAMENSILNPSLRDSISAGGRKDIYLKNYIFKNAPRIFLTVRNLRVEIVNELIHGTFDKDWGRDVPAEPGRRIDMWAQLVVEQCLDHVNFPISPVTVIRDLLLRN